MQLSAATFSDPAMRSRLEQYYENQKAAAVEAWKARESEPVVSGKITTPGSEEVTLTPIIISHEKLENAFAGFDDWLTIQQKMHEFSEKRLEMAQKGLERLEKLNPESSSNVRAAFSVDGQMLAYINADGGLALHSGAEFLQSIAEKANDLGLSGQSRIDYMSAEIGKALSRQHDMLRIDTYDAATSPSKRAFTEKWYPHADVDQLYQDALAQARSSYADARAWHDRQQESLNAMRTFLLSLQEAV